MSCVCSQKAVVLAQPGSFGATYKYCNVARYWNTEKFLSLIVLIKCVIPDDAFSFNKNNNG